MNTATRYATLVSTAFHFPKSLDSAALPLL